MTDALDTDRFDNPKYEIAGTLELVKFMKNDSPYKAGTTPALHLTFTPPEGFFQPKHVEFNLMVPNGYSIGPVQEFFLMVGSVPIGDPSGWSKYQHLGPMPVLHNSNIPEGSWFLWSTNDFFHEHSGELFKLAVSGPVNPSTPGLTGEFRLYLTAPDNTVCQVTFPGVTITS